MTHAELVQAAVAQLKLWRCPPIISEMHCANIMRSYIRRQEQPNK